jgi:hypothetical protein
MSCYFRVDKNDTHIIGGIYQQGKITSRANLLAEVVVKGNSPSNQFDLPPGMYRFEFHIADGGKFTLSFFSNEIEQSCKPSGFDPNDTIIARVSRFTVGVNQ